jgi:hypothetical protein
MLQYCVRRAYQTLLVRDRTAVLWDASVALNRVNDVVFSLRTTLCSRMHRAKREKLVTTAFRVDPSREPRTIVQV